MLSFFLDDDGTTLVFTLLAFFVFLFGVMVGRFWRSRFQAEEVPTGRCSSCGWRSLIGSYPDGLCAFCRRFPAPRAPRSPDTRSI